jgi:hypothetical protein
VTMRISRKLRTTLSAAVPRFTCRGVLTAMSKCSVCVCVTGVISNEPSCRCALVLRSGDSCRLIMQEGSADVAVR